MQNMVLFHCLEGWCIYRTRRNENYAG